MHRESISKLKTESFDLLIIGGGATGCGIALDAATRGLKTALIEKNDFSSGTSSRSTKLIHGGVRYLEQAFIQFDRSQYNLVKDALKERYTLLQITPHLVKPIPILTPLYKWAAVPYYLTGLKLYDKLSGKYKLHKSEYINTDRTLELFPLLQRKHLRGSVLYYDGQFDDARMNVLLARTAEKMGAIVSNYVEVKNLKKTNGKMSGVEAKDILSGETFSISAKMVINATGPFVDTLRKLDNPKTSDMVEASSGSHMVLDKKFCSNTYGLLIPKTEDNRVLFFLPWNGHTLVGTTDNAAAISDNPKASLMDRDYLLQQIKNYFTHPISTKDVLSTWSGLRPLIKNPGAKDTARLSRDHEIEISDSNLITIAGGKWTTYRKMAEDAVNTAIERGHLKTKNNCLTEEIKLVGSENYNPQMHFNLSSEFKLTPETGQHLSYYYGDHAEDVIKLDKEVKILLAGYPYIESEIRYAVRYEYAHSLTDILVRRIRIAYLNISAAKKIAGRVADIMGEELGWNSEKKSEEIKAFLSSL